MLPLEYVTVRVSMMSLKVFRRPVRPDVGDRRDVDAVINANVVIYLGICEETRPAIEHMLAVLRGNREVMSTIWYGSRFTVWYFFSQALHEIAPETGEMIVPRIEATAPVNSLELAVAASTSPSCRRTATKC